MIEEQLVEVINSEELHCFVIVVVVVVSFYGYESLFYLEAEMRNQMYWLKLYLLLVRIKNYLGHLQIV